MKLVAITTLLYLAAPASDADPTAGFDVPVGQRQLFLDDHGVAGIENLRRTLHRPKKRGAVIRSPSLSKSLQIRSAPAWDVEAQLYKLWVLTAADPFWQSKDGLHWTPGPKPNLRTLQVVYDPLDPDPARRFKTALTNQGFAVSPDGITWTKIDIPKIPSSDEANFTFDAKDGLYIYTVKRGGKFGRSVAMATSRDFKTWQDFGLVFGADEKDQELGVRNIKSRLADPTLLQPFHNDPSVYNVDVYNMGVFRYEGVYLGLPAMFHSTGPVPNYPNTDGFHLIQLVSSRDLKNWKRLGDRETFIGPSRLDSGAYDLTQILPPSAPLVRGDELWFYYTGLKYRASFNYVGKYPNGEHFRKPGLDPDGGAICLAILRRDGFISLDAGKTEGSVVTKPFRLPASKMFVNAAARDGQVRVEMLNPKGDVLARSLPLSGDHPRGEVKWEQGDIDKLLGQDVSLRFRLRNGSLYSYWFDE